MAASLTSLRQRAQECYGRGDLQGAHRALLSLLDLEPDDAETLNDLGTVCFSLGRLDDAERYYARALGRDPACEEARENLRKLCRLTGSTPQAALERAGGEDSIHAGPNLYDISVIVPVHSRFEVLEGCLHGLNGQTLPAERFEVILAVNGVRDEQIQDLQGRLAPWRRAFGERLRTLRIADASIAAARNEGIRAARGMIVLQMNEDTWLTPSALARHWGEHEGFGFDARRAVVGGRMFDRDHRRSLFNFLHEEIPLYTPLHRPGLRFLGEAGEWFVTCNLSAPREAYGRFGLFDPAFRWGSDAELGRRWEADHGVQLCVNTDIISYHQHWLSFDSWKGKIVEAVPFWCRRKMGLAPEEIPPDAQEELRRKLEESQLEPERFEEEMRRIEAAFDGPDRFRGAVVMGAPVSDIRQFVWRMRAELKRYRIFLQHNELWRRVRQAETGDGPPAPRPTSREQVEVGP